RRYLRQNVSAEHAADDARNHKPREQAPIDVSVRDMTYRRCRGGEGFDRVHARGCGGGRDAEGQKRGGRGGGERHAERTVDELSDEAHRDEGREIGYSSGRREVEHVISLKNCPRYADGGANGAAGQL